MEKIENPVFGRKVFFLQPSLSVERYLIEHLKEKEYEVYIIEDVLKIKNLLSAFPNSMCFVDIDSGWSFATWFSFLKSFDESESLNTIFLGIISEKAGWDDKDKFLVNLKLPGGFTIIDKKSDNLLKSFTAILDLYGAKGRRKYIRLDTQKMNDVSGYLSYSGKLFTYNIKDISSAGFAITYKQEMTNLFQKNTHITNLCISLGRKSLVCSCIIFNTQINNDGTAMSVLMLTNENSKNTINFIRDYVFEKNIANMNALMTDMDKDSSHYEDYPEYFKFRAVRNRNYEEMDIVSGADSL